MKVLLSVVFRSLILTTVWNITAPITGLPTLSLDISCLVGALAWLIGACLRELSRKFPALSIL